MTAHLRRHGPGALAALMLALGVASVVNFGLSVGEPFAGVLLYRNHLENLWQVEPSTPPWWPALAPGALRYDDVVEAIDGVSYGPGTRSQVAAAHAAGRTSVRASLRRGGHALSIDLPIRRFTLANFLDVSLPEFINGFGLWFLAVAVFRARPDGLVNRTFAATFVLMAGAVWATMPGLFVDSGTLTRALQLVWAAAWACVGAPFLHLALLVPEPVRRMPKRLLALAYAYGGLMSLVYMAAMVSYWRAPISAAARGLTALGNAGIHALVLGAFSFCAGRLILLAARRDLPRRVRRQVLVLVAGIVLCSPYFLIKLMRSLGVHGNFWNGLDLRCMMLLLPISLAFLILRYQTFRQAHPAIGLVLILGSSAFLASVGSWVLRLIDPAGIGALSFSPYLPLFAAASLASLLWSTETSWRESFARLFDWHRRSYVAARQFGQEVVNRGDLSATPEAIVEALVGRMELERAALWLWRENDHAFALAAHAGAWSAPAPGLVVAGELPGPTAPVRLAGEVPPGSAWLLPLRESRGIEVAATLWASGRPIGLLALGKRWDEEIFDERDLEIVELIAQQAALFLLTAAQIDQLRQVPHQIAETQERERFKIAQELHDTVQQFLGRLPFYLEVSRSAARDDPAETESILERCMTDVESAAQTVREIRANLAPLQLERSLAIPLRRLVAHFTARSGVAHDLALGADVEVSLGLEARHAVYRVVQQALDNVTAHAEASHVTVTVEEGAERVLFAVRDDGRGFADEQRTAAAERGSFGLTSMRARITSLGGDLTIESAPGIGTCIRGWLPRDPAGGPAAAAPRDDIRTA